MRSVIASQVYYSKHSNYFFYTYILYELQSFGDVLPPKINVMDFLPNIYSIKNGSLINIFDILRIVIVSIIMLTGSIFFWRKYEQNKLIPEEERSSFFFLLFETSYFSDLFIFVFYIACCVFKFDKLDKNLEKELLFTDIVLNSISLYFQSNFEFYNILMSFESQIILECLLVFGCLIKLITLFNIFSRVKIFFLYVINAFAKIFSYFLLVLFLIVSFSFFSNNLWGSYSEQYRDLAGSLTATLLLSIGHFTNEAFSLNFTIWNVIYIFLFFMIFIYFITTSFVGIYMESSRLNCLKYGNSYEYRTLNQKPIEQHVNRKKTKFWCFYY